MANTFYRKPVIGADENAWAQYNDEFILYAIGGYSSYLYDDSGSLKISKGRIGINNDTNRGVSKIDTITTISLTGLTISTWAQVEMSVSGTSVTFTITSIAGANDTAIIPTEFISAFDPSKSGYYINASKRTIGIVWIDKDGLLQGVINSADNEKGYRGYNYLGDSFAATLRKATMYWDIGKNSGRKWEEISFSWNMDSSATKQTSHFLTSSNNQKIKSITANIINNTGSTIYPCPYWTGMVAPVLQLKLLSVGSSFVGMERLTGGTFDDPAFNAATGWFILEMEVE